MAVYFAIEGAKGDEDLATRPVTPGIRYWVTLALSLLVAVGSGSGLLWWATTYQRLTPVLVAARDLPAFTVIDSDDLSMRLVPEGSADPETMQDRAQILGKQVVAPVYRGEGFRPERLATESGMQIIKGRVRVAVREGERLLGLPVDLAASAGGSVTPGDLVDIYSIPSGGGGSRLAAAGVMAAELRTASGHPYEPGATTAPPAMLLVRVSEGQVRELLDAMGVGKLVVARRSR